MTTPVWQAGTLYSPGALVRPVSTSPTVQSPPTNAGFESGNVNWTLDTGFTIGEFAANQVFQGTWSLQHDTDHGIFYAINSNAVSVSPGQTINASLQVQQGASSAGDAGGGCAIAWYDASDDFISYSDGVVISSGSNSHWRQSTLAGVAPAGAAFARFAVRAFRNSDDRAVWFDNAVWDATPSQFSAGLIFRAVQAVAGYSGSTEPVWPIVNGEQVIDNQVTWEAVFASRVVWEASPILTSGGVEPDWPTLADGTVADGTIKWVAMNARVTEAPHSKIVAIAASKIFAGDHDIIPFSATVNPLDWTTPDDAGYLPFGLQTYGATDVAALGLYRSNLVAFNAEGYQMWQVDEDPANMALLDASPVPCNYAKSVQPAMNDLIFLSPLGIRNLGIAGASTNIQSGFFGKPIDPLIIAAIREDPCTPGRALFYPGAGQYWIFFGAEAFVLTMNGGPKDASWSRYVFPDTVDAWAINGVDLLLRAGDIVWRVSPDALQDDVTEDVVIGLENGCDILGTEAGDEIGVEEQFPTTPIPFPGSLHWQYLDFGQLGVEKELEGFDLVCTGRVAITFGYDQSDFSLVTESYTVDGDTLPGNMIPFPISGPSFQFRLDFEPDQAWEWNAAGLYLSDSARTP